MILINLIEILSEGRKKEREHFRDSIKFIIIALMSLAVGCNNIKFIEHQIFSKLISNF